MIWEMVGVSSQTVGVNRLGTLPETFVYIILAVRGMEHHLLLLHGPTTGALRRSFCSNSSNSWLDSNDMSSAVYKDFKSDLWKLYISFTRSCSVQYNVAVQSNSLLRLGLVRTALVVFIIARLFIAVSLYENIFFSVIFLLIPISPY